MQLYALCTKYAKIYKKKKKIVLYIIYMYIYMFDNKLNRGHI